MTPQLADDEEPPDELDELELRPLAPKPPTDDEERPAVEVDVEENPDDRETDARVVGVAEAEELPHEPGNNQNDDP